MWCRVIVDCFVWVSVIKMFVVYAVNIILFVQNANSTPLSAFLIMIFLFSRSDLIAALV